MNKFAAMFAICAITITSSSAFAGQILEYSSSYTGVSGSYDGTSFENKTLTFRMVTNTDYIGVDNQSLYYDYPMLLPQGPTLSWISIEGVVDDQITGVNMRLTANPADTHSPTNLWFGVVQDNGVFAPLSIIELPDTDPLSTLTSPGSFEVQYGLLSTGMNWWGYFTNAGGLLGGREIQVDSYDLGDATWEVLPLSGTGNPIPGIGGIACLAALGAVGRRRR